MIFVKLKGGLGNQLFQYAFGLSVAKKLGVRLALDIYDGFEGDFFQRNYMLNRLNISSKPMSIDDLKKIKRILIRYPYGSGFINPTFDSIRITNF